MAAVLLAVGLAGCGSSDSDRSSLAIDVAGHITACGPPIQPGSELVFGLDYVKVRGNSELTGVTLSGVTPAGSIQIVDAALVPSTGSGVGIAYPNTPGWKDPTTWAVRATPPDGKITPSPVPNTHNWQLVVTIRAHAKRSKVQAANIQYRDSAGSEHTITGNTTFGVACGSA